MGFEEIYTQAFRNNFTGFFPSPFPFLDIEVGDYGTLKNDFFIRLGNIWSDYNIDISKNLKQSKKTQYESFSIGAKKSVYADLGGQISNNTGANLKIEFSQNEGVFFETNLVSRTEFESIRSVQNAIETLYKDQKWEKGFVLVSAIEKSKNTILAVSSQANSEVILQSTLTTEELSKLTQTNISTSLITSSNTNGAYIYKNTEGDDVIVSRLQLVKLEGIFRKSLKPLSGSFLEREYGGNKFVDDNGLYDLDINYNLIEIK